MNGVLSDADYRTWMNFYRARCAKFRFPVYPGSKWDQIATREAWADFNASRASREWTTLNNEAGKDRTRDAVSISVTVRPMPFCAKVSL